MSYNVNDPLSTQEPYIRIQEAVGHHLHSSQSDSLDSDGAIDLALGPLQGILDFLEAHVKQQLEHTLLAVMTHRIDQRLVAIAQIDRAPDRRGRNGL